MSGIFLEYGSMKMFKKAGLAVIVAAALSAWGPINARANTVYSYTGNDYTVTSDGTPPSGAYDTTMSISGSFTLASPLSANLPVTDLTPNVLSFSFFDGRNTITNLNQDPSLTSFTVTTDATGRIDQWLLELNTPQPAIDGAISYTMNSEYFSGSAQDAVFTAQCVTSISPSCAERLSDFAEVLTRGNWIATTVPSATPLPGALPLFATGLGALGLLGWRRKRKAVAS
jgi:hypothetical protein